MSASKSKNVLLVAFHFPPLGESSGLQRTLSLANDLAEAGWAPIVLTVTSRTYRSVRRGQVHDVDPRVRVYRAWTLDAARDLSLRGKYPRLIALPDVWSTWLLSGLLTGLWIFLRHRPALIWSTYPIATAHLLALAIAWVTGCKWIADFRDSMTEASYPADRVQRRVYRWIEQRVVRRAQYSVFTTPGTLAMYSERYPASASRFRIIANGFDERYFGELELHRVERARQPNSRVTLLHSGVVYPSERDPRHLFGALHQLKVEGIDGSRLRVILRASGFAEEFRPQIEALDIADVVFLEPSIEYRDALREMLEVDGLLVLQAANCNHQIPAKIYEYFRSGTPIIALTDPKGDTARLLAEVGSDLLAPLDDVEAIRDVLARLVRAVEHGRAEGVSPSVAMNYTRKHHAERLQSLAASMGS